jgi:hypothetical protein
MMMETTMMNTMRNYYDENDNNYFYDFDGDDYDDCHVDADNIQMTTMKRRQRLSLTT